VKTNIKTKFLITFLITITALTACNLGQQRRDAINARNKSDSIITEFNKINQRLEQEYIKLRQDNLEYEKKMDSLHHLLDSL